MSSAENEVLDRIECDLTRRDPGLHARMSRLDDVIPLPRWARIGGGLAFAVMLLVFVVALPPLAAWTVVVMVAAAAFLPWLLSAVRVHDRP